MNITLIENLKSLRKNKGNTQEELAAHLGLSMQSISKWERGESYPDIELLPKIAFYYNVTVDELLGVGELRKRERMDWYTNRINELTLENKFEESSALVIERFREFPNDLYSKSMYIMQMCNEMIASGDFYRMEECVTLGDELLERQSANIKSCGITANVVNLLMRLCVASGNRNRAREYVPLTTGTCHIYDNLAQVNEGEDAVQSARGAIAQHTQYIAQNINIIIKQGEFDSAKTINALKSLICIYESLYSDGNLAYNYISTSKCRSRISERYLLLGEIDTAFKWLSSAADDAGKYALHIHDTVTSPLLTGERLLNGVPSSAVSELLLILKKPVFDSVRNDTRFSVIEQRLSQYI